MTRYYCLYDAAAQSVLCCRSRLTGGSDLDRLYLAPVRPGVPLPDQAVLPANAGPVLDLCLNSAPARGLHGLAIYRVRSSVVKRGRYYLGDYASGGCVPFPKSEPRLPEPPKMDYCFYDKTARKYLGALPPVYPGEPLEGRYYPAAACGRTGGLPPEAVIGGNELAARHILGECHSSPPALGLRGMATYYVTETAGGRFLGPYAFGGCVPFPKHELDDVKGWPAKANVDFGDVKVEDVKVLGRAAPAPAMGVDDDALRCMSRHHMAVQWRALSGAERYAFEAQVKRLYPGSWALVEAEIEELEAAEDSEAKVAAVDYLSLPAEAREAFKNDLLTRKPGLWALAYAKVKELRAQASSDAEKAVGSLSKTIPPRVRFWRRKPGKQWSEKVGECALPPGTTRISIDLEPTE